MFPEDPGCPRHSPYAPEDTGIGFKEQLKNLRHREVTDLSEVTQPRGDQARWIQDLDLGPVGFYGVMEVPGKELKGTM